MTGIGTLLKCYFLSKSWKNPSLFFTGGKCYGRGKEKPAIKSAADRRKLQKLDRKKGNGKGKEMITTITLNASIDKAYHMSKKIENGTVMRVAECRNSAGGKGLNVARVIRLCGSEVQATGLVGGFNGSYLEALLDQDGISHRFGHVDGETRSCINILDPGYGSTEYLEPGFTVSEKDMDTYLRELPEIIKDSDVVTISGSAPSGVTKDIYQKIVEIVKSEGKLVLLDTSGDLLKNGIKAGPTLIKPNQDEIEALFNEPVSSRADVVRKAKQLHAEGIPYVVISLGGDGALLVCEDGVFQAVPPKVDVVNTVGCGDSMVGAFAVALEQKKTPKEALRYASAVGTANALSPNTGDFDPKLLPKLLEETEIREFD